ncbi:MAG: redox-sensing transcriptional repressor Rex [Calditrichaeota bacterium]|nr:MAG: redox-sensing transcriptional repressor Rex [Calditrichota bacterium]MBL1206226.1 redox-sensing transcriptional repressor Rex [Calditrichota bacterium]NOG46052.1 redox-sensing transcriptional repressor Rex [Calditrichota bacterium]
MQLPEKTIERLLLYKVLLLELKNLDRTNIHSHELAEIANNNSAQVRRDIMATGFTGIPAKGYQINDLINKIKETLNLNSKINMCLVGIGNLGSAIIHFFGEHNTRFELKAAFDTNPQKVNNTIAGCKTYKMDDLSSIIKQEKITLGIIATPASNAQQVANSLVENGIKGIFNFTSHPLQVPKTVKLNRLDITLQLEKLAFFSH